MSTVNTSVKIDAETKKEAQKLFKDLGMSLSTAINIFLKQAVKEQGLPFYIGNSKMKRELSEALKEIKEMEKNPTLRKSYNSAHEMIKDVLGDE